MTIAEQLIAKGRAEGLTTGTTKGQAELLRKQLSLKFGQVPPHYEARLTEATLDELGLWAERVLSAATVDEVFADANR